MKLKQIVAYLDALSPFELQEKWDNSGLLVGDKEQGIDKIVVSLDVDEALIDQAPKGALFVVHHPLIFSGLKQLDFSTYPAKLLKKMILKDQVLIAMHTNFDKTHLNAYVFEKVLGFTIEEQEEFLCYGKVDMSKERLFAHLKEKLGLEAIRSVAEKEHIGTIALCTGAGASMIDSVKADCFLTGDIKYHDAMKAMTQGLMMVDIAHYESERFFSEVMAEKLKDLGLLVIMANSKNPFHYETLHPKG